MLFSHLLKHLLKNNNLIHQDNNLLLVVRLRSVHDRFYHFNLVRCKMLTGRIQVIPLSHFVHITAKGQTR
ncbi:hypothetical protein PUR50_28140, partial [Enterobacter hormaechei subsp. steigerwaltii]|nr:hypothetical protein [Enterobacter hormaechei subsp. steigerwaltii]